MEEFYSFGFNEKKFREIKNDNVELKFPKSTKFYLVLKLSRNNSLL